VEKGVQISDRFLLAGGDRGNLDAGMPQQDFQKLPRRVSRSA
jgi:hypothetical protein